MLKILALLCITTKILCQDAMEPDVRYGYQNDRFDVGAMIQHSKAYFNDEPSYQSRIDESMKADDDIMDALPERRSGVESSRRKMESLVSGMQQRQSRRAKDKLTNSIQQRQSRRAEDDLVDAVPQRRSRRAEDDLEDAVPQRRSRRTEDGDATPQKQYERAQGNVADDIPQRRQDYAYHDKMDPDKDPKRADYEANLKAYAQKKDKGRRFKNIIEDLHAGKIYQSRRNDPNVPNEFLDPELEIVMRHAVPINAKFQGYLTAPLVE